MAGQGAASSFEATLKRMPISASREQFDPRFQRIRHFRPAVSAFFPLSVNLISAPRIFIQSDMRQSPRLRGFISTEGFLKHSFQRGPDKVAVWLE